MTPKYARFFFLMDGFHVGRETLANAKRELDDCKTVPEGAKI